MQDLLSDMVQVGDMEQVVGMEQAGDMKLVVYVYNELADEQRVDGIGPVHDTGQFYGNAQVLGMLQVHGTGKVQGMLQIHGMGKVHGMRQVHGLGQVYDKGQVLEHVPHQKHSEHY